MQNNYAKCQQKKQKNKEQKNGDFQIYTESKVKFHLLE